MPNHDVVVIGASAGGIEALQLLVGDLPRDLPASVFVVEHLPYWRESMLDKVLAAKRTLPVHRAENGRKFKRGEIYVAVPDHHLLVEDDHMAVVKGPKENRSRPAIDPLFRSAAIHHGPRTIGVILSGVLDDGTSGLWQIKRSGGITVVQDPEDALFDQMPRNALNNVEVDHTAPIRDLGSLLTRLVKSSAPAKTKPPSTIMKAEEQTLAMNDQTGLIHEIGKPSQYTCPECHGCLFEIREGNRVRYRCRTGHAYAEKSLLADQMVGTEEVLWAAMRALREKSEMLTQQAGSNSQKNKAKFQRFAKRADKQALIIRDLIEAVEGEDLDGDARQFLKSAAKIP